jgi:predicted Holliday junction resolvase-like endonuclease
VDPLVLVSALLVGALIVLVLVIRYYSDRVARLQEELQGSALARRRAAETSDRWRAQWMPVLAAHPFDPRRFRFVGGPIDGVQFEEDKVLFVAFASEGRPPADPRVRDLVRAGRVEWVEVPVGASMQAPSATPAPGPVQAPIESWAPQPQPEPQPQSPPEPQPEPSSSPPPTAPSPAWPPVRDT